MNLISSAVVEFLVPVTFIPAGQCGITATHTLLCTTRIAASLLGHVNTFTAHTHTHTHTHIHTNTHRLPEGHGNLPPQHMEVVCRCRTVDHLSRVDNDIVYSN